MRRAYSLVVGDFVVEVSHKPIKHTYIRVLPPEGKVAISAPIWASVRSLRRFIMKSAAWIERHQRKLAAHPVPLPLQFESGESHFFLGELHKLSVFYTAGRPNVERFDSSSLSMSVSPHSTVEERARVLEEWYRRELKRLLPGLFEKWERVVGVQTAEWNVRKMRSRWGSCDPRGRRISLSLELAKKPLLCVEYVVVHELTHLHEKLHNRRFWGLMDHFMPDWRVHRARLDQASSDCSDSCTTA